MPDGFEEHETDRIVRPPSQPVVDARGVRQRELDDEPDAGPEIAIPQQRRQVIRHVALAVVEQLPAERRLRRFGADARHMLQAVTIRYPALSTL